MCQLRWEGMAKILKNKMLANDALYDGQYCIHGISRYILARSNNWGNSASRAVERLGDNGLIRQVISIVPPYPTEG